MFLVFIGFYIDETRYMKFATFSTIKSKLETNIFVHKHISYLRDFITFMWTVVDTHIHF